ncbi:hypothetical protein JOF56_005320 [Kibdelosporangium banguiense]|uniref:DUF2029 domain-containing protein n=1 Tax=Kibdelosporangium banguiense TaxID=1365924 RepID=A0ABS4TLU2_9PSEU|nr:hypothetical protein [Kibdelosporangium banguiense]MBP2324935.1 hypothetical protein [Kibdelosporangium banguiense]
MSDISVTTRTASPARAIGATVGFAAVVCVLSRLLLAGHAFDRVWAEDGAVFLVDARTHGFGSLIAEYSGYAHLVPRILALIGSWLPLAYYALFTVTVSAVVVGLLAWYVYASARHTTSSPTWALIAALALALAPAYRAEALGNLANLQWFLLPAAAWAVIDTRRTRIAPLVILAAATTSPLTILLLPALLLTHGRTALRTPATLALAAGLGFQAVVRFAGIHSVANPAPRSPGVYPAMATEILESVGSTPWAPAIAGIILIVLCLAAWFVGARKNLPATAFVVTSALFVAVPTVLNGSAQPRYVACGFVALVWAACLAAPALRRTFATGLAVILAASALLTFTADPYRVSGPSWTSEINSPCGPGKTHQADLSPQDWGAIPLPC